MNLSNIDAYECIVKKMLNSDFSYNINFKLQ